MITDPDYMPVRKNVLQGFKLKQYIEAAKELEKKYGIPWQECCVDYQGVYAEVHKDKTNE